VAHQEVASKPSLKFFFHIRIKSGGGGRNREFDTEVNTISRGGEQDVEVGKNSRGYS